MPPISHGIVQLVIFAFLRIPHFPVQRLPYAVEFRGAKLETELVSYNINEMLATKMRALFQRKKGRDRFDLYWALSTQSALAVSIPEVLQAFDHYMQAEGEPVAREKFIAHLRACLADRTGLAFRAIYIAVVQ
jgi:predicted nucleotidyltransferase component of viral defense system